MCVLTPRLVVGVDYVSHEMHNDLQEIEYLAGELDKEEYEGNCWRVSKLRPLADGQVFEVKSASARYSH